MTMSKQKRGTETLNSNWPKYFLHIYDFHSVDGDKNNCKNGN